MNITRYLENEVVCAAGRGAIMRKLRLAVALPILQILVALVLLLWADRTPIPRNVDFYYHPSVRA